MRERKYRAWDKNTNTMVYQGMKTLWNKNQEVTAGDILNYFEDEDIMDFVGLHDKNGKEIYEGDIVNKYGEEESPQYEVIGFGYGMDNESYGDSYGWLVGNQIFFGSFAENSIVVGNRFENPSLLKGTA